MASSAPVLVLVVGKGPKSGEVVECNPGRLIRIGRVVKGNTLTIKDPGISQNHLLLEFLPALSRWAVSDLATSNGTLVNGVPIPPSAPHPLSHADTIKIGEDTSISVQISAPEESPPPPRLRRGRPAAAAAVSDPAPEANVESAAAGKKRGRGRAKKAVAAVEEVVELKKDEILEPVVEEDAPVVRNTRRGRGRRRGPAATTRVTRSRVTRSVTFEVEESADPVAVADTEVPRAAEEPSVPFPAAATEATRAAEEPSCLVPSAATEVSRPAEEVSPGIGEELAGVGEGELGAEEVGDYWESMTLGQWFDRLEILLPRAINNVADEIIADLKDKARRFDEYSTECSNDLIV